MENATIYANKKVSYRITDYTYAGIAYSGDVDIILKGDNTIYLNNDNSSAGLFVYDGNVYISGDGNLFVGYDENYYTDRTIYPIQVLGDLDVLQGKAEGTFADSGNLTINSGNITLDSKDSFSTGCLYANNKITINGGTINTIGNSNAIYSNYNGEIEINGGTVVCKDFRYYGLMARGGDVSISGDNTKVELLSNEDWTSSVGIYAGEKDFGNGNVYISGGETKINVGSMGIQASADGFVSDVSISGGKLEIIVSLDTRNVTGIYNTGKVKITGGNVNINTSGDVNQAISIWSVQGVDIDGGNTTVVADSQREDKFVCGIYTPGDINITKGILVAQGKMQALSGNVFVGEDLYAFGSTQISGENQEEYVSENLANYKYLKFADAIIEKN